MTTRAKNLIIRPYLNSAHCIEEESTILVMYTFCVLTSVVEGMFQNTYNIALYNKCDINVRAGGLFEEATT